MKHLLRRSGALLLALLLLLTLLSGCGEKLVQGLENTKELMDELSDALDYEETWETTEKEPGDGEHTDHEALGPPEEEKSEPKDEAESGQEGSGETASLPEDLAYTTPEDVALYLHLYGHLPHNFLTKSEAQELGWESSEGNLWEVTDRMSIGGDRFGNREGLLPDKEGRKWFECDVNYAGGFRGAERLCYSNDGLIFYTNDHYESFTLLYGGDEG